MIAHILVICTEFYEQRQITPWLIYVQEALNILFLLFYLLECVLKVIALGIKQVLPLLAPIIVLLLTQFIVSASVLECVRRRDHHGRARVLDHHHHPARAEQLVLLPPADPKGTRMLWSDWRANSVIAVHRAHRHSTRAKAAAAGHACQDCHVRFYSGLARVLTCDTFTARVCVASATCLSFSSWSSRFMQSWVCSCLALLALSSTPTSAPTSAVRATLSA